MTTKAQLKFMQKLSSDTAAFRQVRYEDVGLSYKGYRDLLGLGLIAEAWTWNSRTRPCVALTIAGLTALSPAQSEGGKHAAD
jgi:hypothetical protein